MFYYSHTSNGLYLPGCGTFPTSLDDVVEREPRYTVPRTDTQRPNAGDPRKRTNLAHFDKSNCSRHCLQFAGYV